MRKFYLFLVAAAMAMSAMAAVPFGHQVVKSNKANFQQFGMVKKANIELLNAEHKSGMMKAPAKASEIITEAEGEVKTYARTGGAFYVSSGYLYEGEQEGVTEVVFAADGTTVYFKNPISYFAADTYVKGTLEGNTITIPMGQTIYTWTDYGYGAELCWVNAVRDESGAVVNSSDVTRDTETETAEFVINDEDGTITLQGSNENHLLSAVYDDDNSWTGRADYNTVYTPFEMPDLVVPPVSEPMTTYYHNGAFNNGDVINQTVNVIVDGSDIYFQGLTKTNEDYTILEDAWVKGTIEGNTVTIPSGQFIGLYGSNLMYIFGMDADGNGEPLTMTYDAEANTYTLDNYYAVNGKADELYYFTYFMPGNVLSTEELYIPDVVEVPENLTLYNYIFKSNELKFDEDENPVYTEVSLPIVLGVDENYNMYLKGLCQDLPDAWVVCHYDDDYNLVIPGLQNFGTEIIEFWGYVFEYPHFLVGMDAEGNMGNDIVLYYDADADVYFSETDYIIDNEKVNSLSYYHIYTNPQLSYVEDKEAKPANPEITNYTAYESSGYARINCNIPLTDVNGEGIIADKLFYRVYLDVEGEVEQLTFTPDEYIYLETSMTEVPYMFSDDYDIYVGGNPIYLNQPNALIANKVGLQTVYYGGLTTTREVADNESDIVWYEIKPYEQTAVDNVNMGKTVKSVRYYNLAGMQSSKPFSGMNIVETTYNDGTKTTVKVIK